MRAWLVVGCLSLFGRLLSAFADKKGGGPDGGGKRGVGIAKGELVEELTASTYVEKVVDVVNGTEKPAYAPVVMFHMPWCEHCKKTIPELQETAEKVDEAAAQGQLAQYPARPRFFMLSCAEPGVDEICETHTGKSYPSIIVFRDGRAIKFNRPRMASVITWWVFRVSRPAVSLLDARGPLEGLRQSEVAFLLHLKSKAPSDMELLDTWQQLALDHIEDHTFLFTLSNTPLGKTLGTAPSVHVYGPDSMGLQPLPAKSPLDDETLKAWVGQNQFPPVVEVSPWTMSALRKSGLLVVAFVHTSNQISRSAMKEFESKALDLRQKSGYVFGTINSTDEDNAYFIQHKFPLLYWGVPPLPRIFVFSGVGGQVHFWEDPQFASSADLTLEAIEALLRSPEAFHDETWASWFKERRKLITRVAGQSWMALLLVLAVPLISVAFCCMCLRTICQALFEEEEPPPAPASKTIHVD